MLNFLTESVSKGFEETKTIGGFGLNANMNDFDAIYERAADDLKASGIDPMTGINDLLKRPDVLNGFKNTMLRGIKEDCNRLTMEHGENNYTHLAESIEQQIDNCIDDWKLESTSVGQLLPIKTVDLPVLIKSNLTIASKDIIQTEVTASPVIKKHIERRWIVDKLTKTKWEYPQCFFKNEFKEIYNAGKGWPIKDTAVDITGGLFQYNVAEELTDSPAPEKEKLPSNLKIISATVIVDPAVPATTVEVPVNVRINMGDGSWVGGEVKLDGTIVDYISGHADFVNNVISLNTMAGRVTAVKFSGYLPNERNERTTRYERTREEFEWKVEDGFKMDVPYSMEELHDAKALLNMDLYKLTYTDLADILVQMEDNGILSFLDAEYTKYQGIQLDPLGFNSFIRETPFDADYAGQTTALPSEYVQNMLKYTIDRFVTDLTDTAKIENMTFVVYGNPRYISLLDSQVNWVVRSGDSIGGVKANYSYGIMNSGNVKIQVVSTMKYDGQDDRNIRIIPYPVDKTQFTFKHYKYSTHILTAQNSAYRPDDLPGGSMTYLLGVIRNVTTSIQGIQGSVKITNLPYVPVFA